MMYIIPIIISSWTIYIYPLRNKKSRNQVTDDDRLSLSDFGATLAASSEASASDVQKGETVKHLNYPKDHWTLQWKGERTCKAGIGSSKWPVLRGQDP